MMNNNLGNVLWDYNRAKSKDYESKKKTIFFFSVFWLLILLWAVIEFIKSGIHIYDTLGYLIAYSCGLSVASIMFLKMLMKYMKRGSTILVLDNDKDYARMSKINKIMIENKYMPIHFYEDFSSLTSKLKKKLFETVNMVYVINSINSLLNRNIIDIIEYAHNNDNDVRFLSKPINYTPNYKKLKKETSWLDVIRYMTLIVAYLMLIPIVLIIFVLDVRQIMILNSYIYYIAIIMIMMSAPIAVKYDEWKYKRTLKKSTKYSNLKHFRRL